MADHYETLKVARSASAEVIREAYRALARLHHPDSGIVPDEERMTEINVAEGVLGDPAKRARYDAELETGSDGGERTTSAHPQPSGKPGWGEGGDSGESGARSGDDAGPGTRRRRTRLRAVLSIAFARFLERTLLAVTIEVVVGVVVTWALLNVTGLWGGFVDLLPWTGSPDALGSSPQIALLEGHGGSVPSMAFSPDGRTLATASADATVRLWDLATREPVMVLSHGSPVEAVAFSPDGRTLATASGREVRLWDPETGDQVGNLDHRDLLRDVEDLGIIPNDRVLDVAFSPDGEVIATSTGVIGLWDAATRELLTDSSRRRHVTGSLAFSPDGAVIASPSVSLSVFPFPDSGLHLWDAESLTAVTALEQDGWVGVAALSPQGGRLATADVSGDVALWDAATSERVTTLEHSSSVTPWASALAFSPDGRLLASAGEDHKIKLWRTADLTSSSVDEAGTLSPREAEDGRPEPRSRDWVLALAFSPDGTLLASADGSGRVVLWDTDSG